MRAILELDVEKLRAKAAELPADHPCVRALADYDRFVAGGEKAMVYLDGDQLVVGTVTDAPPAAEGVTEQ